MPTPGGKERDSGQGVAPYSNLPPEQKWTLMINGHRR